MKTTVQVEGKTVEVEIPGVVSEADVAAKYMPKEVFEGELTRRATSIAEKQGYVNPTKLDAAGKKALLETLGVKTDGSNDGDVGKQLERAKGEWSEKELKPVLDQVQTLKAEIEGSRSERLRDALVTAAAKLGVKSALLNAPVAGAKPPIVAMLEQAFAYDEKTRTWYAKGANGFAFASSPTEQRPYKDAEEFLGDWARKPENREFFGQMTQQGPGLQGGGIRGGVGVISRADYKNPAKYRVAKEAADKAGVELQVVD